VYAGDPEKLSLRAAFPKVHEFEGRYGSVLRGAMKSRPAKGTARPGLCSFREGMDTLPRAIAARLGDSVSFGTWVTNLRGATGNGKLWFEMEVGARVTGLQSTSGSGASHFEWEVGRQTHGETRCASTVIVATPADRASRILSGISNRFAPYLSQIEYAPLAVVSIGYRREQLQRPAEGFGFLVPRSEGLRVLGTVFNSSLFVGRASEGMVCFTSFAGGATDPALFELSSERIVEVVCAEVGRVLGITGSPIAIHLQGYGHAIPQYNLGHTQIVKSLEGLAAATPGLFLAGNYLSGPSIGSCIEQARRTANAVRAYLASTGVAAAGAVAHG
jgi:protoporphyrinogen/coproporphyrinogen III oxidase